MLISSDSACVATREHIKNIWQRARINAFAHRTACEKCRSWAMSLFMGELVTSLFAILGIVAIYLVSTDSAAAFFASVNGNKVLFTLYVSFASIFLTLASLFLSVMANYMKFEVHAEAHAFLLGSYQHIAQRAREVDWPDKPQQEMIELLKDLERDFQILKTRGIEPDDKCFVKANKLFGTISSDPVSRKAQSFHFREDQINSTPTPEVDGKKPPDQQTQVS